MFTLEEILKATKGTPVHQCTSTPVFKGISTDTRTIRPGDLFIALVGEKFDGHGFVAEAIKKGAAGAIISKSEILNSKQIQNSKVQIIKVKYTLKALQQLAKYHRNRFKIPVIGITGSSGKTTTKDMLASILSEAYPTLKNEENFNNEIGVPLTLLKLNKKHKAAVIEMAMQGHGEIAELVNIAHPTIAIVTNIGEAHLLQLKTQKNIAKAKAEILQGAKYAVLNADDEYFNFLKTYGLRVTSHRLRIITFRINRKADVSLKNLKGIKLPVPGKHNIYNALAAIAVAKILGLTKKQIKNGLEKFKPSSKRSQIIDLPNGIRIINDCYNANPSSMKAALELLGEQRGRKIAVLGEMLELGKAAKPAHNKILALTKKLKIDAVLTFGKGWKSSYPTKEKLTKKLKSMVTAGDTILIKGSRGTKMEEVVDQLIA
ncbi:MAG: UDP-N-acetylmuramoyl-tripeptide--D-alanyl-D-alanine ligase [Candidatus Saganbacteria bacterium]|nr:UDP-N-acetylmuramoyl-tripeptide--D-alanyl-D-alanine ligase [Candidatus Saganbacteria bacterium]